MSSDNNNKKGNRASNGKNCCSAVRVKEEEEAGAFASSTSTTKNTSTISSPPQEEESQRSANTTSSRDMVELLSADSRDMVELLVQEIGLEGVIQHVIQKHGLNAVCRIVDRIRQDHGSTAIDAVIPSSVSSGSSGSAAATAARRPAPTTTQTSPVAFVEKDLLPEEGKSAKEARKHLKKAPLPEPEEEGQREGRRAPLPETIASTGSCEKQQPISNHDDDDNDNDNNNKNSSDRVIIESEDSLTDEATTNSEKGKQGSVMSEEEEEDLNNNNNEDDACSTERTKRGKRKQCPSEEDGNDSNCPNNSLEVQKKKKKNTTTKKNRHDRERATLATGNNAAEQTIRNNQHQEDDDDDDENKIDAASTIVDPDDDDDDDDDDEDESNYDETDSSIDNNHCRLCNDPDWEGKIYYKCGTIISKYFPKSDNNPNPGWYEGTIRMHHLEADTVNRSKEESERIYNKICYKDGDMENITQSDLKIHLMDGRQVRILHSTEMATTSNSECHNRVVVGPPPTSSDSNNQKWLEKYHRLQKFKDEHGHCRVPQNYGPDPPLGIWVHEQRKKYKKGNMASDRVEKLNKIGFDWVLSLRSIQTWDEMLCRLEKFKDENGHCRVPQTYGPDPPLGIWVHEQRKKYKKGNMASGRVVKLNKIGFEWVISERSIQTWGEMLCRLKQFKDENGPCRVPGKYVPDPPLGNWVGVQRQDHKKGTLAPDRIEKLNEIGFDWVLPERSWDKMLYRLKQFKAENGHCRVPQKYGPDAPLGNWVSNQRQNCKKGTLARDRVEKLNQIGFEWALRGF